MDKRYSENLGTTNIVRDSLSAIHLTNYKPNLLVYESSTSNSQLAVFSEIFYDKGWSAYINDVPTEHIRVNYILRAMIVPPGENKIEFKFKPKVYLTGEKISLAGSVILLLVFGAASFYELRKKNEVVLNSDE